MWPLVNSSQYLHYCEADGICLLQCVQNWFYIAVGSGERQKEGAKHRQTELFAVILQLRCYFVCLKLLQVTQTILMYLPHVTVQNNVSKAGSMKEGLFNRYSSLPLQQVPTLVTQHPYFLTEACQGIYWLWFFFSFFAATTTAIKYLMTFCIDWSSGE